MSISLAGAGEFARVRQHLDLALTLPAGGASGRGADGNPHTILAVLVDTAAQQRDLPALLNYLPQAETLATAIDHRLYQAVASRARGVAAGLEGDFAEAEGHLQRALDLFHGYEARWQLGRTYFELGECARRQAGTLSGAARAYYEQARQHFEAMQAAPDLARLEAVLAQAEE